MQGNRLTKRLLLELILGEDDSKTTAEILDSDEISSVIDHQWNSSVKYESGNNTDYTRLFVRISETIKPEKGEKSTNSIFLIKEIEKLRRLNTAIQNRYRIALGIAASLLFIIMVSSVKIIRTNRIFEKTITESIAPFGQKSQLVLADETKVYLNSGTIIRYDNHFGKRNRKIELVGEAYFEVSKNKKIPFIISTSDVEIKVLGTKFNVTAYPDDPVIETYVTEGKVNVKDINSEKSLILGANQKASFSKDKKQLTLSNVNVNNFISWKENILYFDNENFENIIKKLERWYNVSIRLEGKDSIDDRFTLTIKDESLREVLDLISLTTPMHYKLEGNNVTIVYSKRKLNIK
jgi:transmembrane sensor